MKAIFVLDLDEEDDVDRLATQLICHPAVNSVKHVPTQKLQERIADQGYELGTTLAYRIADEVVTWLLEGPDAS